MQESSSSIVPFGSSIGVNLTGEMVDYLIRKSDLDDL